MAITLTTEQKEAALLLGSALRFIAAGSYYADDALECAAREIDTAADAEAGTPDETLLRACSTYLRAILAERNEPLVLDVT